VLSLSLLLLSLRQPSTSRRAMALAHLADPHLAYPPALGCDALLNAWCSACCDASSSPLVARKITKTAIVTKKLGTIFFWGCHSTAEMSDPLSELNLRHANDEGLSSRWCGLLSDKEPRRYKSGEQRLIEFALRKCAAQRKAAVTVARRGRRGGGRAATAPHTGAPSSSSSSSSSNRTLSPYEPIARDRPGALAVFKAECAANTEAQAERRALMVAKGLYNFPYPPAHGCDARLTQYCAEVCPTDPAIANDPSEAADSPKAFLARKIVRVAGGGGVGGGGVGGGQGRTWAWGCFPRAQLVAAPPPRFAKLKQPKLSRNFFCGVNASGPTDWRRAAAINARMHDDLEAIANVCEVWARMLKLLPSLWRCFCPPPRMLQLSPAHHPLVRSCANRVSRPVPMGIRPTRMPRASRASSSGSRYVCRPGATATRPPSTPRGCNGSGSGPPPRQPRSM
jgi:hypothetical protein